MLGLALLLWGGVAAGQEAAEEPERSPEEEAQWAEIRQLWSECEEAFERGHYQEAVELSLREIELMEALVGESHPEYATSINNLAVLYTSLGRYEESLPLTLRAAELNLQLRGEEHPAYAKSLINIAELYKMTGSYDEGLPYAERASELLRRISGPDHPSYAQSLHALADLKFRNGAYQQAEPLYQQALSILRASLGEQHHLTARSLKSLAGLMKALGAYEEAQSLYLQALEIERALLGEEHPSVGETLNNLTELYLRMGHYEQAMPLGLQASELTERLLGAEHPSYANTLINLGTLYAKLGDSEQAIPLLNQSASIWREAYGEQHPDYATALNNLSDLYHGLGDLQRALSLAQQALEIRRLTQAQDHVLLAMSLAKLGRLHAQLGDVDRALSAYTESLAIHAANLEQHLLMGSPAQKAAYVQSLSTILHFAMHFSLELASEEPAAAEIALQALLQSKGRIVEAEGDTLARLRDELPDEDQLILSQLQETNSQLERAVRSLPEHGKPVDDWTAQLASLSARQQQLQQALSRSVQALTPSQQIVSVESVAQQLPPGSGLLEWTQWWSMSEEGGKSLRYAVYLLTPEGISGWADLGTVEHLDQRVALLRSHIQREGELGFQRWGPASRSLAEELYQDLLSPLQEQLEELDQLFLSPYGELSLLPFDSLMRPDGVPLGERYLITRVTSGRDLLRLDQHPASELPPVVIAGVDFGSPREAPAEEELLLADAARALADRDYRPLAGAEREGAFLHRLLWNSELWTGSSATEGSLKQMPAPSLLHIATHGYFLPADPSSSPLAGSRAGGPPLDSFLTHSPLLRSGLVLAGVNEGGQGEENGFLSAAELIHLDLRGTELVVLSACETGLGEVQLGEGLQGLSKALQVAGSETQIVSLWQVSDEATQELMQSFYSLLLDGVPRGEALRQAKARLRADPRFEHPYYWAPFVLSGDWRALDSELGRPPLWRRWLER